MVVVATGILSGADIVSAATWKSWISAVAKSCRCHAEANGDCQFVRGGIQKKVHRSVDIQVTGITDERKGWQTVYQ